MAPERPVCPWGLVAWVRAGSCVGGSQVAAGVDGCRWMEADLAAKVLPLPPLCPPPLPPCNLPPHPPALPAGGGGPSLALFFFSGARLLLLNFPVLLTFTVCLWGPGGSRLGHDGVSAGVAWCALEAVRLWGYAFERCAF